MRYDQYVVYMLAKVKCIAAQSRQHWYGYISYCIHFVVQMVPSHKAQAIHN